MKDRNQLIKDLLRQSYMQPEQLEAFLQAAKVKAPLMNKKVKAGSDLEQAIEKMKSDAFLDPFVPLFENLTADEIQELVSFYASPAMKKFTKVAKNLGSFYQELEGSLLE